MFEQGRRQDACLFVYLVFSEWGGGWGGWDPAFVAFCSRLSVQLGTPETGLTCRSGGQQGLAVGREFEVGHELAGPFKVKHGLVSGEIPEFDGFLGDAAGREAPSVGRECDGMDPEQMAPEGGEV